MENQDTVERPRTGDVEQAIRLAVRGIRFGSVEIIIHDSKVVQVERKEKLRFGNDLSRTSR